MIGDGTFLQANQPQLVSIEISLSRLAPSWDGFRIAQLSDFHYDDFFSITPIRKAIEIVNRLNPDLVVLTGDVVTSQMCKYRNSSGSRLAKMMEACAQLVAQLRSALGILAVLGNHDLHADHVTAILESHGISVLRNRSVFIERNGKRIWLSGVEDILAGKPDLKLALKSVPPHDPVIHLAHEPDWADYVARYPVDLQLSGHSHGGQIRLPLIGVPYLPPLARKYPQGLYRIGPLALYTNSGIGTIDIPMRLNCRPEVTLITLRAPTSLAHRGQTQMHSTLL